MITRTSEQLRTSKLLIASLLLAVATAGLSTTAGSAQAAFSGDNGKIALVDYSGDPHYAPEIYTMNPDGSGLTNLTGTNSPVNNSDPAFSPDGTKIAFARSPEDPTNRWLTEIYTMNTDGSGLTRLTYSDSVRDHQPTWSPDGKKIAFASSDDSSEIYVMNLDGSGKTRLGEGEEPTFSPDGKKIAFTSNRNDNSEIYIMNADGSDQKRLTNDPGDDSGAAWSPDGTSIAFQTTRNSTPCSGRCAPPRSEIYVMNADGSGQKGLTDDSSGGMNPAFSPDGTKIAFNSSYQSEGGTYIMNTDGSEKTKLADSGYVADWGVSPAASAAAPEINAPHPAPDSTTRSRTPRITANVRDDQTNLAKNDITLSIDGRNVTSFDYDPTTGQLSYKSKRLSPGIHEVRVNAKDEQGLSETRTWNFEVVRR